MLTLSEMSEMSSADLDREALVASNRQYSLALTRMAHAVRALESGDRASAFKYVQGAKTAYLRAQEDERGQLARVAAVQAVAEERESAIKLAQGVRKNVASNPALTTHAFTWHVDASDR